MRNAKRIAFTALSCLVVAATVWAGPQQAPSAKPDITRQQSAQTQSVSGKIASIEKDSFTLNVASAPGQQLAQEMNSPKTMTFLIDKNTTVDGKLKVNSTADVTYRQDNGTNIAISVRVTP